MHTIMREFFRYEIIVSVCPRCTRTMVSVRRGRATLSGDGWKGMYRRMPVPSNVYSRASARPIYSKERTKKRMVSLRSELLTEARDTVLLLL